MYKTYLREHETGRMESVTRGLSPEQALAEYRRLLGRKDLIGERWAAVLRNDIFRRTILFSRFDMERRRLLPTDKIDLLALECNSQIGADGMTDEVISGRRDQEIGT